MVWWLFLVVLPWHVVGGYIAMAWCLVVVFGGAVASLFIRVCDYVRITYNFSTKQHDAKNYFTSTK